MHVARSWVLVGTIAVSSASVPESAAADFGLMLFAGAQCDAPSVRDGRGFPSSCSVEPLVGAALRLPALGLIRLAVEGQYARRSFASDAFATKTDVRASFVELALLGEIPFFQTRSGLRLSAVLGPQVGIVQEAKRRFEDVDQDVVDELRPSDVKLVAALRLTRGHFFVESGLAFGLTDLDATNQQQIHSRAVLIRLGLVR